MKIADILKACSSGVMPSVKCTTPVNGATSNVGQVVVIKQSVAVSNYFGIWVLFPGLENEIWFKEGIGSNKHMRYMDELEFPF